MFATFRVIWFRCGGEDIERSKERRRRAHQRRTKRGQAGLFSLALAQLTAHAPHTPCLDFHATGKSKTHGQIWKASLSRCNTTLRQLRSFVSVSVSPIISYHWLLCVLCLQLSSNCGFSRAISPISLLHQLPSGSLTRFCPILVDSASDLPQSFPFSLPTRPLSNRSTARCRPDRVCWSSLAIICCLVFGDLATGAENQSSPTAPGVTCDPWVHCRTPAFAPY